MPGSDHGPILILSPPDDDAFRDLASGLVRNGAASPAALEAALQARYPKAAVHRRELSGEWTEVWYVYRDGSWTPPRT